MKYPVSVSLLLAALSILTPGAQAAIGTVDNVPAATLLLPYFEVDPATTGATTTLTIGNASTTERVAHVTLWTDRGVPTFSFDVRLPARGVSAIDLGALFRDGTLPQSTAGGVASCAGVLPPVALSSTTLTGLRNAHSGQASSLLGGQCGSRTGGNFIGYATIDAANGCSAGNAVFPGSAGYFASGSGVASNANVLFGEAGITNPAAGSSFGETLVHIEASASDPLTSTNGNYTFYGRLVGGSAADNRERLPSRYMARYAGTTTSNPNQVIGTTALVWRDPGVVAPFPCSGTVPTQPTAGVLAFDHQEQVNQDASALDVNAATQSVPVNVPFDQGMISYELSYASTNFSENQGWVSHVHATNSSLTLAIEQSQVHGWPQTITGPNSSFQLPACDDGIDNDNDGFTDFPADPGCFSATATTEAPVCFDGVDNDNDGLTDFPADPNCVSRFTGFENGQCNDLVDNDLNMLTDFPADPGCRSVADFDESPFDNQCSDGIDNNNDGRTDFPVDPNCFHPFDNTESAPQCSDGLDNDNDGAIDFPADPGCFSAFDNNETNPACNDGLDNDNDGLIDFPNDPGCSSAQSNIENPQCSDGSDNDGDMLVDFPADPGCESPSDTQERAFCSDGVDNDGDMLVDFPNDPGCASPASNTESPACNDNFDNDFDGQIDFPADIGCAAASDPTEEFSECSDGLDNDGDGLIDFPNSPNCTAINDPIEAPACSDGEDNDFDGQIDFPNDPGCSSATDANELLGYELIACSDGIDNDGNGLVDWPADPGCLSAGDDVEASAVQALGGPVRTIPVNDPLALLLLVSILLAAGMVTQHRRS